MTEVSGNAQVQDFYINTPPNPRRIASPTKSPRQTTQSTSPWRIRLTVQAEQVDEMQRSDILSVKHLTEQTTTITVPLKGSDDTPPAAEKKGRGRPRKSLESPVKRAGTPKPKVGVRRRTMPESPKKQEMYIHKEKATPPRKPRGRPRKSMEAKGFEPSLGLSQKTDSDVWLGSSLVGGEETAEIGSGITRTRSRGRRQEITPMRISVGSDVESQSSSVGIAKDIPKELTSTLGNRHDESGQLEHELSQRNEAPIPRMEQSSASEISRGQSTFGEQDGSERRPMMHHDNYSPSPYGDDAPDEKDFDLTSQHQDYDSVLESEGFSMVSVSSLPSVGDSFVSHSQPYGSLQENTPTITPSPSTPPAPESAKIQSSPRQLEIPFDGTPKLEKVVRAGLALQDVLSPNDRSQKLDSPYQESQKRSSFLTVEQPAPQGELSRRVPKDNSPEEPFDDLYRGFGVGTRRELKAGLRLGEELAKRYRQSSQKSVVGPKEGDAAFQQPFQSDYPQLPASDCIQGYSLKHPGSEKQVGYPLLSNNQLPSPERSLVDEEEDRMSWRADTPIKQEEPESTSAQALVSDKSVGENVSAIDTTMMARQEEWRREREAVSKQIEMANKSQVIIIDSDDDEEEEGIEDLKEDVADSDIWQAEAQSVDKSRETAPDASEMLLQPEVLKPRRSKIPSPWRRNSEVVYSDEVEPTESDLFWQPDQSQARASKRRDAKKDQTPDHSDVSSGSVLEFSLENTRKAEAQIQLEASVAWRVKSSLRGNDEDSNTPRPTEHALDTHSIPSTDAWSIGCSGTQGRNPEVFALPVDGIKHAIQATKDPVVKTPSKQHHVPELLPNSKEVKGEDVKELSEKVTNLKVTGGTSMEPVSQTSKNSKAVIDPRLFQGKTGPLAASNRPIRPIQLLQNPQTSTSWLSRLTAPIWSVFAPTAPLPPAATKEDILCSSPHEPLCQLTPWEECHFRALGPLYYGSLLFGAHLFPFNPRSPSARYCGAYVTTKLGWSRKIRPEDCGITDAFMVLLDERGFALGEPGARWIDEGIVIAMCVALWVGMVKRGEVEVDRLKGERLGLRDEGDRKWTKDDIDWASNESAYFERKRREFEGLPSWKNKA